MVVGKFTCALITGKAGKIEQHLQDPLLPWALAFDICRYSCFDDGFRDFEPVGIDRVLHSVNLNRNSNRSKPLARAPTRFWSDLDRVWADPEFIKVKVFLMSARFGTCLRQCAQLLRVTDNRKIEGFTLTEIPEPDDVYHAYQALVARAADNASVTVLVSRFVGFAALVSSFGLDVAYLLDNVPAALPVYECLPQHMLNLLPNTLHNMRLSCAGRPIPEGVNNIDQRLIRYAFAFDIAETAMTPMHSTNTDVFGVIADPDVFAWFNRSHRCGKAVTTKKVLSAARRFMHNDIMSGKMDAVMKEIAVGSLRLGCSSVVADTFIRSIKLCPDTSLNGDAPLTIEDIHNAYINVITRDLLPSGLVLTCDSTNDVSVYDLFRMRDRIIVLVPFLLAYQESIRVRDCVGDFVAALLPLELLNTVVEPSDIDSIIDRVREACREKHDSNLLAAAITFDIGSCIVYVPSESIEISDFKDVVGRALPDAFRTWLATIDTWTSRSKSKIGASKAFRRAFTSAAWLFDIVSKNDVVRYLESLFMNSVCSNMLKREFIQGISLNEEKPETHYSYYSCFVSLVTVDALRALSSTLGAPVYAAVTLKSAVYIDLHSLLSMREPIVARVNELAPAAHQEFSKTKFPLPPECFGRSDAVSAEIRARNAKTPLFLDFAYERRYSIRESDSIPTALLDLLSALVMIKPLPGWELWNGSSQTLMISQLQSGAVKYSESLANTLKYKAPIEVWQCALDVSIAFARLMHVRMHPTKERLASLYGSRVVAATADELIAAAFNFIITHKHEAPGPELQLLIKNPVHSIHREIDYLVGLE